MVLFSIYFAANFSTALSPSCLYFFLYSLKMALLANWLAHMFAILKTFSFKIWLSENFITDAKWTIWSATTTNNTSLRMTLHTTNFTEELSKRYKLFLCTLFGWKKNNLSFQVRFANYPILGNLLQENKTDTCFINSVFYQTKAHRDLNNCVTITI